MSHELRTPLNAILGYSEILLEDAEETGAENFIRNLTKIHSSGEYLLELINAVLDISKAESGKMEVYLETFDVDQVVEEVIGLVQPLVRKNGNQLKIERPSSLGSIHADRTKLRQCLLNLMSNACKFTSQGTIMLACRRGAGEVAKEWVWFDVRDTGMGMTPEQMTKLFQPFSQASASVSAKYGGSGLGLALTRTFCNLMGGDVTLQSKPGEGSTFTIALPAALPDDRREQAAAEGHSATEADQHTNILVIDDDPAVHDLIRRSLAPESFRIITASSSAEGLHKAGQMHPDLIVLDVILRRATEGWDILAALKSDPQTCSIPVLMLSIIDDRRKGFLRGASEYLVKPVDKKRLETVLARFCKPGATASDKGCVLVVDDRMENRELMRRMLESDGWTVHEANNGKSALVLLKAISPQLILLDLVMPEMDGFQFIAEMSAVPEWQGIPVVVVTAKELTEAEKKILMAGAQQIVDRSSLTPDDLLAEVRHRLDEVLQHRKTHVQNSAG